MPEANKLSFPTIHRKAKKVVDISVFVCYNSKRRQGLVLTTYGGVAHLGERLHGMQEVRGSIPLISTNREQNEHSTLVKMIGNVFVLFCSIPEMV